MEKPTLLIDKTIKKIELIHLTTGVNIKVKEKTPKDKYRSMFMYIMNFLCLDTDIVGSILWFSKGLYEHRPLTELTYVGPCLVLSLLSNIKIYYMLAKEKTIDVLIENMRKLENEQAERMDNEEIRMIIKTEDDHLNKVIAILKIFYSLLLIGFALSPLTLILLNYLSTNKVELLLPFLIVYPFDALDMRYYPWVYIKQIWSEIVVVVDVCAADFMFYIFCSYLRTQFRLLGYNIEHNIVSQTNYKIVATERIRSDLVDLIKWHQQLKCCVDLLESIYTKSTLFNFVSSSILICFTGFNVMTIDDIAYVLTFLCFLMMSLLQIYFLCSFGDLLMESSTKVADAIYNSKWYLTDAAVGKTLLLIQIRSQTPCRLTAYKFAVVNLNAFMKVCSTAWSYFALLQTLYRGPNE